jgi:hypothetical protein
MESTKQDLDNWIGEIELIDPLYESSPALKNKEALKKFIDDMHSPSTYEKIEGHIYQRLKKDLEVTVPWLISQMPLSYLASVPFERQVNHILALAFFKEQQEEKVLEIKAPGSQILTLLALPLAFKKDLSTKQSIKRSPATLLGSHLSKTPVRPKEIRIYTASEQNFGVCEIKEDNFNYDINWNEEPFLEKKAHLIKACQGVPANRIDEYLASFDKDFLKDATIKQLSLCLSTLHECMESESGYLKETLIQRKGREPLLRMELGFKNFLIHDAVENIILILNRYGFVVTGLHGTESWLPDKREYTLITAFVEFARSDCSFSTELKEWGKA